MGQYLELVIAVFVGVVVRVVEKGLVLKKWKQRVKELEKELEMEKGMRCKKFRD